METMKNKQCKGLNDGWPFLGQGGQKGPFEEESLEQTSQ